MIEAVRIYSRADMTNVSTLTHSAIAVHYRCIRSHTFYLSVRSDKRETRIRGNTYQHIMSVSDC